MDNERLEVGRWWIERHLNRLTDGSTVIRIRPQLVDLLIYLAERPNSVVSAEELLSDVWGDRVVTNASVYNCIAELRNALETGGSEALRIETIPRRGYRLLAPDSDIESGLVAGIRRLAGRNLTYAILVSVLMAGVIVVALLFNARPPVHDVDERSIAVLPFANLSSDPSTSYLSDGMTEEILNSLARLPDLRVAARTSSFNIVKDNLPVSEIAERLGIRYIVEGSVRLEDTRLRVVVQLIRATDGFHVWSKSYDENAGDIISIQESIAEQIAMALNVVIDEPTRNAMHILGTRDVDAYQFFLKGRQRLYSWFNSGAVETIWQAKAYLDLALEADPRFAAAYALRSHLYLQYLDNTISSPVPLTAADSAEYPRQQALAELLDDVERAAQFSRDPGLRHLMLVTHHLYSGDFGSLRMLAREVDPTELAVTADILGPFLASLVLSVLGENQKAVQLAELRLQRNPLSPFAYNEAWRSYYMAGDSERASEVLLRGLEISNNSMFLEHNILMTYLGTGQADRAVVLAEQPGWGISEFQHGLRAFAYAAAGRSDDLRALMEQIGTPVIEDVFFAVALRENGQESEARELFARLDARPGYHVSFLALATELQGQIPFDVDWTPEFAARLNEAGIELGVFEMPVVDDAPTAAQSIR